MNGSHTLRVFDAFRIMDFPKGIHGCLSTHRGTVAPSIRASFHSRSHEALNFKPC